MTKMTSKLNAGEINLDLIPLDWPLTPVGKNKNPYIAGWQGKPFTIKEVKKELDSGIASAVGLISGPVYQKPYGLVWVDIDGPTVKDVITSESGLDFDTALPKTLTICSGRQGRERKLYLVPKDHWPQFARNKYNWHAEGDGEKLEVLWKKHQGVLMGFHPDTDGYFTKDGEDFDFVNNLTVIPDWLLKAIAIKNKKQGKTVSTVSRMYGENFAINTEIGHDYTIKEVLRALWCYPESDVEDYEKWLTAGQVLHTIDDSLLEKWDEWSQQASNYEPGACQRKWRTFTKDGGRKAGTIFMEAAKHGFKHSQEHTTGPAPDQVIDRVDEILAELMQDSIDQDNKEQQARASNFTKPVTWPPQLPKGRKHSKLKAAPQNLIRDKLVCDMHKYFVFDESENKFFKYEHEQAGMWSKLTDNQMRKELSDRLDIMTTTSMLPEGYQLSLIDIMFAQLKAKLEFTEQWNQDNNLILFQNGVYDLDNSELGGFHREYYINRTLPYEFDPSSDGDPIIEWLSYTQEGDYQRVQLLRAWLRAVLVGNSKIQRFLELIGPGGTGKTSFTSLCHALVGWDGAAVTTLERIEKNRFEMAKLYSKRLCLFNDVSRYGSTVDALKQLTGADVVNNEHKYKQEETNFRFTGLVMVTANEQVQMSDPTSGLARRRITIPFRRVFQGSATEVTTLIQCSSHGIEGKFAPFLPGLVNWLLKMSDEDMRNYLLHTNEYVPAMKHFSIRQKMQSNPILDWMNACVIFDPGVSTYVGTAKPAPKDDDRRYKYSYSRLYASYREFCDDNGTKGISRNRFEEALDDIFPNQLKINIYRDENARITRYKNVNLRDRPNNNGMIDETKQHHYPSVVELSCFPDKYKDFYAGYQITAQQDNH